MPKNKLLKHPISGKMFEPYRTWNTIITLGLNFQIMKIISDIGKSIEARIYQAQQWQDIAAIPCFYVIIDPSGLKENILKILFELWREDDVKVIFTEIPDIEIPDDLHKKIIVNEEFFLNREKLKIELLNHKTRASHICNTERKYDSKIFRLLSILKKLKAGKYISSTDLACEFNVSAKTISRDIDLLRQIGEIVQYDTKKRAYYLEESILWDF